MALKKKVDSDVKSALVVYGAITVLLIAAMLFFGLDNSFPVTHNPQVAGNSNYPESYTISVSPALAFKYGWGFWRVFGLLVWAALGVFMVLINQNAIGNKEGTVGAWVANNPIKIFVAALLLSLLSIFAFSSDKVAGNKTVTVDPQRYDAIKDNSDSLKALFPKKTLF